MIGWMAFGALLLCAIGAAVWFFRRERARKERLDRLHREAEAFLHGGKTPDFSVEDEELAFLRNDIADLAQEIVLARDFKRAQAEQTARIIADISHQLKTPLAGMRLYCEMDAEDGHPSAQKQLKQIDKMEKLVLELLKLEKLNARAYEMEFAPGDLREICQRQIARFAELYPKKRFSLAGDMLPARFDADWMGEAIGNVVKNACEHTNEQGKIEIRLAQREGFAWVSVQDDGGGVPENKLPLLFARFSRLSASVGGGTGLGLAIVRSILESHHGGAVAENNGEGLRVSMYLPVISPQLRDMSVE